jgi:AcrR family transcriptional regulator
MPPKYKVTKDAVLDAAYSLLERQGRAAVTTRAIAELLGISSRPIYSFFPSMDSLVEALLAKAVGVMKACMKRDYTRDPFLNSGVGYVRFALEKPNVSDFINQSWSEASTFAMDSEIVEELFAKTRENPEYAKITREAFLNIFQNTSIYTYGLVAYARATKTELSEREIIEKLYKAGEAFIVQYLWSLDKRS